MTGTPNQHNLDDVVHDMLSETFCGDCEHPRCKGKVKSYTRVIQSCINLEALALLDRLKEPTINDVFPSKPYDGTNTYEDMRQVIEYYKKIIEVERRRYAGE
jgi:hypothetical protein